MFTSRKRFWKELNEKFFQKSPTYFPGGYYEPTVPVAKHCRFASHWTCNDLCSCTCHIARRLAAKREVEQILADRAAQPCVACGIEHRGKMTK